MIGKKVPHTYIAEGMRYFALLCPVETQLANGKSVKAYNFYIFDEEGYCWTPNDTHNPEFHLSIRERYFTDALGFGGRRYMLDKQSDRAI